MARAEVTPARRADARQNIEKILGAAVACLGRKPDASVNEIAQAAGVGRMTLYGHFATREALVEAALRRVLEDGDAVLEDLDLDGDPPAALRALIESSWLLIAQASAVLEAAQATLPPERIRELHAKPELRVHDLIRRGQAEGAFRDDLPVEWLAGVLFHLMKGAAADVVRNRLDPADAPRYLAETVLAAYAGPRAGV
ncbi:TetR/AcrR family transcriptional regulator [Cryptosporangium aurantiacum]|uniref:Transcriptional regulator, TetR family n=1 Tax=Cryptosporangium aurantiacum TaxID=134849 RepID=A0A1M7PBT9_9ACTN|nr:TetR/AcrR family transcriptional regulator [Cryptosporangium aurantiacum]SHN14006.1 transcriptional regulator, TetR family [Cryptosporangium aurantiacum]